MPIIKSIKYYNNTPFHLEIQQSNIENAGLGLFLQKNTSIIPKNKLIGYYEGFWNYDTKTQSNCSYYINKRICIDIDFQNRPYTSLMNDAFRTRFQNNIMARVLLEPSIIETIRAKNCENYDVNKIVGLYSTRDILPGDELFFEYGEAYWKSW